MSLFGSLQMAGNTLQAMQIGLHVVGNNIANANTPGYVRERTIYTPAPVQDFGNLSLGLGVEVEAIVQVLDKSLESRLRDAGGDRASAEVQEKAYRDIQAVLGELTEFDISTAITDFVNNIGEVTGNPEDVDLRNLAINSGVRLAERIANLDRRVSTLHRDFSDRVSDVADEMNTLTEQIRQLNLKIVTAEGGGGFTSEAGGLRSQRNDALKQLAELADITVNEQDTGSVNVSLNGDILVFEGTRREVVADVSSENGLTKTTVRFAGDGSPLSVGGGEIHGLYEARDTITNSFLSDLDTFASTLINEFNKVYSLGQGIRGYDQVTGTSRVSDPDAVLNEAGLDFTPENGSLTIYVKNDALDETKAHNIPIDLNGLDGNDTTLNSLAAAIDAIDGISAEVSIDNQLVIRADSKDVQFGFGVEEGSKDSHVLAALGLNTFFTGSDAGNIGVNEVLTANRLSGEMFAASLGDPDVFGEGTENALKMIAFYDESIDGIGGQSISGAYDQLVNQTTQGATVAASVADGLRVFEGTLAGSAQAVSGVNLDEEAIDMIQLQRTYQASARYIQTLSEMLDVLVNL